MELIAQVENGSLTLAMLFSELVEYNEQNSPVWVRRYRELVGIVQKVLTFSSGVEADAVLKRLWYERDNGIANLPQGGPSIEEFERNLPFFRQITEAIRQQPNEDTYQQVTVLMQEAKKDGKLSRMYKAMLNRVFAAFVPHSCSTTVVDAAFMSVARFLNWQFRLGLEFSPNAEHWFRNNHSLKQSLQRELPREVDAFKLNMAIWRLRQLLEQRDTSRAIEKKFEDRLQAVEDVAPGFSHRSPINQILFGPPGTGKTYTMQQKMKEYTLQVQPTDYDVWLDARLEPLNWMQVIVLVLLDKQKTARVPQLIAHPWFQRKARLNGRNGNLSATAWGYLQNFTVPGSTTVNYTDRREPAVFDKTKDSEWFLVESQLEQIEDLQTLYAELKRGPQSAEVIQRFAVATFHQSYGYEEFIEGIRARSDGNGVTYPIEPGVFLRLCQRAKADPTHRYAMFIDEINRGNISRIFGELISLIETDKRAGMENALSLQLAYSGEPFSVPANVDIIGAMNTADRSLALMDTALRRRFEFIEMAPDLSLLSGVKVKGIELEPLLERLNNRIEALYDREHRLGHAFFMPVKAALEAGNEDDAFKRLTSAFRQKVIPLLQEYFFDDWNKIRLVLADNQKPQDELQFFIERADELDLLFGDNHGLRRHNQQSVSYELKDFDQEVWLDPKAYRAIYQPVESQEQSDA
ncbi:AAA family ATPase [Dickeya oryzae]|uniref:McrB family protein n=1 Tax=Dickeya oryzae TaxID=1240404 RepID=UPI001AECEABF|nr:AAA family ATPase [Dickeya oryzae]MBP2847608.1 AAA family ATPase [Dickeya oryzae]